jgi:diacylglycerol O-acyltransferase
VDLLSGAGGEQAANQCQEPDRDHGGGRQSPLRMAGSLLWPTDPALAVPFGEPRSMFNARIGAVRSIATRSYDIGRLRYVAEAGGVTLNEILLVLAGGALRRAMAETGGRVPALTAGVPVSTRAAGDMAVGNVFTLTVMRLATDVADPIARIRLVGRSSRLAKRYLRNSPKQSQGCTAR